MTETNGQWEDPTELISRFVENISDPDDRLSYVIDRIQPCRGISGFVIHRAMRLASEVLGVSYEIGSRIVQRAFIGIWDTSQVGSLNPSAVGFVYIARMQHTLEMVKVGFSRDVDRRERELRTGAPGLKIFARFVGTMMDEFAIHCDRRALRIEGEWFRADPTAIATLQRERGK